MKNYEIWSEGYVITGNSADATYHGTEKADSFRKACAKKFKNNKTYDPERNTLWGCRLFDNETEARKSFG